PEQPQAMRDGPARATDDARGLSVRDLGDERPEGRVFELRVLEAVVDAKRLRGERSPTLETEEALDGASVAGAGETTLEAPAPMAGGTRGAIRSRADSRLEAHGSPSPGRGRGCGPTADPADSRRVQLRIRKTRVRPSNRGQRSGPDSLQSRDQRLVQALVLRGDRPAGLRREI